LPVVGGRVLLAICYLLFAIGAAHVVDMISGRQW
jgi:hypothetical protein